MLQLKLRSTELKDIDAEVLHDVIQDPMFRSKWDDSMKNQYVVEQLDENSEIGYYSVKMPFTIANRDWVNMRSWYFNKDKTLFIIMNHSVKTDKCPEKSGFVRANSMKTGYMIEKTSEGTVISYFTWNSWNGWLPNWLINKVTKSMVTSIIDQLRKACEAYPKWKAEHSPEEKYWMIEGPVVAEAHKAEEEEKGEKKEEPKEEKPAEEKKE